MPEIKLTIPAGKIDRIVHALCVAAGYEDETPSNAKQAIIDHIGRTGGALRRKKPNRSHPKP